MSEFGGKADRSFFPFDFYDNTNTNTNIIIMTMNDEGEVFGRIKMGVNVDIKRSDGNVFVTF